MRQIAETLACDSSNVTGIIDRLEDRNLVKRTAAEHDRRIKLLVLTEEGEALRREIDARVTAPPLAISGLPAEDLRTLEEIFNRALSIHQQALDNA
jgi:DNA-binding MarR family transcriptional regulator